MRTLPTAPLFPNLYLAQADERGDHVAIEWPGQNLTYADLQNHALRIAAFLREEANEEAAIGLFATRSLMTYAGALGIMLAGKAYVPLNTDFPEERLSKVIKHAGLKTLLIGSETLDTFPKVNGNSQLERLLFLNRTDASEFISDHALRVFYSESYQPLSPQEIRCFPDANAYILFTSGSTGDPKGIAIQHCNLNAYLSWALPTFPLMPQDRCSQTFEMSFDLSVHDLLVTLCQGATLVIPGVGELLFPAHYAKKRALTSWFSVPAMAMQMKQLGHLKKDALPLLKFALFCGEALPGSTADAFAQAAPNARCFNLYGPTEATIAATSFEWKHALGDAVVPIGRAFPHMQTRIDAGEGELWLAGPQLAEGYLNAPELTQKCFVSREGKRWYRTGDRAEVDENGNLRFLGRIDHQVKRYGYRIELGEIEGALRRESQVEVWVVLLIKRGRDEDLIAVCETNEALDMKSILERCRTALPSYMIPSEIRVLAKMPLNSNGKLDRRAIAEQLDQP